MIGKKVILRYRMGAEDAHFSGDVVDGANIVKAWGDIAAELSIRLFGDESLFLGYSEIRFTSTVHVGDFMEFSGYIEKVGGTSITCRFEAHKVIELAGGPAAGLAPSAANVLHQPVLCAYGKGTVVVKRENQRPEFADPDFREKAED
ncbi:MAG: hypothetical protein Q4E57_07615 [Eubacteriales bacterium]|nr:hypothetical protein [Eubacteriales bacterium]